MKQHSYSFFSMFRSEHYKSKRNPAMLIMLLFPVFILLCIGIHFFCKNHGMTETMIMNPWIIVLGKNMAAFFMLYPILAAILSYSLADLEYRNDSLKQLFTLPYSKTKIYLSKALYLIEITFGSVLMAFALFLLSGYLLNYLIPATNFMAYDIYGFAFSYFGKLFLSLTAIVLLQFCLSLIFKNFVVPVGVGCFMTIFSMILHGHWKFDWMIPYCGIYHTNMSVFSQNTLFGKYDYASLAAIAILGITGYFLFIRRRKTF